MKTLRTIPLALALASSVALAGATDNEPRGGAATGWVVPSLVINARGIGDNAFHVMDLAPSAAPACNGNLIKDLTRVLMGKKPDDGCK